MSPFDRSTQHGQAIALFALALGALVLGCAVVLDGGYAFAQRRATQNAADFAAMAGTRIIGQKLTGRPPGTGTAGNVENAIRSVLAANEAVLVSAQYVDEDGNALGDVVGAASIPSGAFGVVVNARTDWQPFLLGLIGVDDWAAGASATAVTSGESLGGGVMPVGIQQSTFDDLADCPLADFHDCVGGLTSGQLNIPGGFGWLKFGLDGNGGKCDWEVSLGMVADGGCESSKTYLDSQIGPPADSHGCCTAVGTPPGSVDLIGSLTGNEWGDISYYVENEIPVWVPVWDTAGGTGANGWYHIVGFGAIIFTGDNEHAKWLEGAAVDQPPCLPGTAVPGHSYCTAPGGSFTIGATGEVRLVR
jgi:hypothetical protein